MAQRLPEPQRPGPEPLLHRPHPSHLGLESVPPVTSPSSGCLRFTGDSVVCPGCLLPGEELQRSPKPSMEQTKMLLREDLDAISPNVPF